MKIKSIRIENFRSFKDETVFLNRYSCFVGPNGSGKSSVLAALNVFFKDNSTFDTQNLEDEDYFCKDTNNPIRITVTFDDLSDAAKQDLSDYVRQGELVVTAEAIFDQETGIGTLKYYGQRAGIEHFRVFFEQYKAKASAADLSTIYNGLRQTYPDLPEVRAKDDKVEALHEYEAAHPDLCTLIRSEDSFYGINSTGKLSKFVTWVYVPAVKDAGEEVQEAKNTALGKLLERTVRTRVNFEEDINVLRAETHNKYQEILVKNHAELQLISESLQKRLGDWAHPEVRLGMEWMSDPKKSISIQQPMAGIKTGEGDFIGSLSRMGHGLQRSYLLALLQELESSEAPDAPTLILGCEEPELYQHPPQARHLADVFEQLSKGNNQILVTTHSPYFVNGDGFENVRITRKKGAQQGSSVRGISFQQLSDRIRQAKNEAPIRQVEGLIAKIHQALQPNVAEMFFSRVPILVEGLEDVSYITTIMHLTGQWQEFRQLGCHLIPVNGKDKIAQPLAITMELGLPVYVMYDCDSNSVKPEHLRMHEGYNRIILNLLGANQNIFPAMHVIDKNYAIWAPTLTDAVKTDFGANYDRLIDATRRHYPQEGGLDKNDLFIADWLTSAYNEGLHSPSLEALCNSILQFSRENTL